MGVQIRQGKKLVVSSAGSAARLADQKAQVAKDLDPTSVNEHLERVVRPKSMASGMKKLGLALAASPDPITDVPAMALIASSYVMKRREPTNLSHLALEAKKILRDIQSLRI